MDIQAHIHVHFDVKPQHETMQDIQTYSHSYTIIKRCTHKHAYMYRERGREREGGREGEIDRECARKREIPPCVPALRCDVG